MSVLKAVLDTNVLVSALLSPNGNPAKIYKMFLAGTLDIVISAKIFEEYQEVLRRPRLQIRIADVETVLAAIRQHCEYAEPIRSTDMMIDEDDRVFYDTAKDAGAYLITGNTKHYPHEPFIVAPTKFLGL